MVARARAKGHSTLEVATAYPDGIVVDGIPLRDRGWLELDLSARNDD